MNENTDALKASEEQVMKNNQNKKKFIIGGLIVLVVIAVALFFGYKKLNSSPKDIYETAINDVYKYLSGNLKEAQDNYLDINPESDPFVVNLNATLDSDIEFLKDFTGYQYNLSVGLDYQAKKASLGLGIKEDSATVISVLASVINDKAYFKSDELIDKVISIGDVDLFSELDLESYFAEEDFSFNYDDFDYILKSMKDIIINSLDEDKFVVSDEKITINDKEYNAKKVMYNLDQENMDRTLNYIVDSMLKDDKLLETLANISGVSTSEIEDSLNSALDDTDYTTYEEIKVILYTNSLNDVIAGTIFEGEEKIISFDCVDDENNFTISSEDTALVINNNDEYTTVSYKESNVELFNFKIYEDDDLKIDYVLNYEGSYSGTIEVKNMKNETDKQSGDFSFSVKATGMNISLDGSFSIEKAEIDTLDTSGSVSIDSLSEEEIMSMYTKLSNILDKFGLSDLLSM